MGAQYQVVGQCAHVKTMTQSGRMTLMLFKGALLPPDAPEDQIRHLLSVKLIKRVGSAGPELPGAAVPATGADASSATSVTDGTEVTVTPDDDPERVAARAKLPADGSLPDGRAGHAVWVEAAVKAGYDYTAAKATGKPELMELLKK